MKTAIRSSFVKISLGAGILGAAGCLAGWFADPAHFFISYLAAYWFWLGISAGCVGLLLLGNLTGGRWAEASRPLLSAGAILLFPMAVLFLPVAFGMRELYPWSRDNFFAEHGHGMKESYLSAPFFLIRAAGYWILWLFLAWRTAFRQDRSRLLGGVGLVLFIFIATFAAMDWGMSLEPHWFSSAYGPIFIVGSGLSALSFTAFSHAFLSENPVSEILHDLGTLVFAFVLLWTYLTFSQYMLIWYGNLPEETAYYVRRASPPWKTIGYVLAAAHFAGPFFLLLFREIKRHPARLGSVCLLILAARWLDGLWLIKPAFEPVMGFHALDAAALLAVGGFWTAFFAECLRRKQSVL